jgi:hypothetical protein
MGSCLPRLGQESCTLLSRKKCTLRCHPPLNAVPETGKNSSAVSSDSSSRKSARADGIISEMLKQAEYQLTTEVYEVILQIFKVQLLLYEKSPLPESASEVYRPSDRRLSAKLVPTFCGYRWHVVSVTDPCSPILCFLDRSHYFFFQVAPQLYSRGSVDPVPDPLLLRRSGKPVIEPGPLDL